MESAAVLERVTNIVVLHGAAADGAAVVSELESGLAEIGAVRAYLDSVEAVVVSALKPAVSFPEATIAEVSRGSLSSASKTVERADTLDRAPRLAGALADSAVTAAHIDAVTRAGKSLDADQRARLITKADGLVAVAVRATVDQFTRRLREERRRLLADDGMDRLVQQRRETSMRTWVDDEGMWNVRGRFDPVSGVRLAAALESAIETLFAERVPEHCPSDAVDKQAFLRAHAFARLVEGGGGRGRAGRPEFIVVIDADAGDGVGGPRVDWSIPVEVPSRVLAEMIGFDLCAAPIPVVVRNGVVLHAPGKLHLGRTTRLASRAQRRALRALYATCGVPGCTVHFVRCKLHHVVWWRHGGRTDLDNLLPLCSLHHHRVHDAGWDLSLDGQRRLTIRLPDGTVRSTGPPSRRAA